MDPASTSQQNWATALQTYRTALSAYRRLLEVRSARRARTAPLLVRDLATPAAPPVMHAHGLDGLTRREREVAELIARGYSNRQIAEMLVLTRGTVANHVAHILGKIGVSNRTQIAARVLSTGQSDQGEPTS